MKCTDENSLYNNTVGYTAKIKLIVSEIMEILNLYKETSFVMPVLALSGIH
jgi:hypothetical protein